ncbi:hypothetical protein, partial [Alteriqipengyuania sp.]
MGEKRTLLNALQKSQMDAVNLLIAEQEHNALCWRSIFHVPHYSELLVEKLRVAEAGMSDVEKRNAASALQWVEINLLSAQREAREGYKSVTRRTVIVLADILENALEATIAICLQHLDPAQSSLQEVTSYRREAHAEREFKRAIRRWESKLFSTMPDRTARMEHMIGAFFPDFRVPEDASLLDELFEARNEFTHEAIRLSERNDFAGPPTWSL